MIHVYHKLDVNKTKIHSGSAVRLKALTCELKPNSNVAFFRPNFNHFNSSLTESLLIWIMPDCCIIDIAWYDLLCYMIQRERDQRGLVVNTRSWCHLYV